MHAEAWSGCENSKTCAGSQSEKHVEACIPTKYEIWNAACFVCFPDMPFCCYVMVHEALFTLFICTHSFQLLGDFQQEWNWNELSWEWCLNRLREQPHLLSKHLVGTACMQRLGRDAKIQKHVQVRKVKSMSKHAFLPSMKSGMLPVSFVFLTCHFVAMLWCTKHYSLFSFAPTVSSCLEIFDKNEIGTNCHENGAWIGCASSLTSYPSIWWVQHACRGFVGISKQTGTFCRV